MKSNCSGRERERAFYSHKAGNQKGHAHQTWCLLFSNISMIFYTNNNDTKKRKAKGGERDFECLRFTPPPHEEMVSIRRQDNI